MRVQLRDCNPPHRGAWRYGRVRGRYLHQHFGTQRRYPDPTRKSPEGGFAENDQHQESSIVHQYDNPTSGHDDTYVPSFVTLNNSGNRDVTPEANLPGRLESAPREHVGQDEAFVHHESLQPGNTTSRQSSPQLSTAPHEAFSQSESYREWYDEPTTVALTPPPSSFGSSASVTTSGLAPATSYPISTAGYYPSPWMQPYPQQMPYPIPYFGGYPGYPMPGQQVAPEFASPAWPAMGGMCSVCILNIYFTNFAHGCFVVSFTYRIQDIHRGHRTQISRSSGPMVKHPYCQQVLSKTNKARSSLFISGKLLTNTWRLLNLVRFLCRNRNHRIPHPGRSILSLIYIHFMARFLT
jgi:hypothetical protein